MLATWDLWKDCIRKYWGSAWSKIMAQYIFVPPSAFPLHPLSANAYTEIQEKAIHGEHCPG